ncbi:MAG TPA: 30S ribosomal protein S16 [Bacteroidota bacterium]|nr:30S ribosomal protein S16 [Bacteroidota bacterium]
MVKLRLRRAGKKKQPIYKIVAADSRASRAGKFIESVGQYNPQVHPMIIDVNETRLYSWLKRGAQPSDTVRSLLQRKGLWLKWTLMKLGKDDAAIALELEKWQMMQADKSRREEEKKIRRREAKRKAAAASKDAAAPPSGPPTEATPAAAPAAEAAPAEAAPAV